MNWPIVAIKAKKPKHKEVQIMAYVYAAILTVMVVAQLFTFDEFTLLVESFWIPGGKPIADLLTAIIVVGEVFALPFLLRLDLSPLMRFVSMVLGVMMPIVWIKLSFWLMLTVNAVPNIGFLGTVIDINPGWITLLGSFLLLALSIYVVWGYDFMAIWQSAKQKIANR